MATCRNCASDCTGSCEYTCRGTCGGICGDSCTGYCKGGCDGCSGTCTDDCQGGCEDNCAYACEGGCSGSCQGGCSTTCTGQCTTACTGTCKNACNSGCSNQTQIDRYDSISAWLNAAIIIDASKVNILKAFIEFELTRRGISLNTHEDAVSGQLTKGIWWDALRTNLEKSGMDVTDTSTTGNIISKDAQSEFIKIAIELYNTVVAKS